LKLSVSVGIYHFPNSFQLILIDGFTDLVAKSSHLVLGYLSVAVEVNHAHKLIEASLVPCGDEANQGGVVLGLDVVPQEGQRVDLLVEVVRFISLNKGHSVVVVVLLNSLINFVPAEETISVGVELSDEAVPVVRVG
jgi:hypothetical protein